LYIQASSAHPESLKIGLIKGELIRYISLFNKAWNRFAKALRGRGYTAQQLGKAREGLDYKLRLSLIKKRVDKAAAKNTEKNRYQGVTIVVPYKPGEHKWWQDCKDRNLVAGLAGLHQEEIAYLLGKNMMKSLSGTANSGQLLKKGAKKRIKKEI